MSEKKFTIQPQVKIILTRQDIDDIMVTALEGGICYWCRKAKVVGEHLGSYASEQIGLGGSLMLHDAESSDKWELTLEKFLDGMRLYLERACLQIQVDDGRLDTCLIDGNAADCIVQYALFGKLVFG